MILTKTITAQILVRMQEEIIKKNHDILDAIRKIAPIDRKTTDLIEYNYPFYNQEVMIPSCP